MRVRVSVRLRFRLQVRVSVQVRVRVRVRIECLSKQGSIGRYLGDSDWFRVRVRG